MRKHIGSTIALVLGSLTLLSGLAKPSGLLVTGSVIILGALAYRSAKKRLLGEVKNSLLRKCLEVVAVIFLVAAVLLQNDLAMLVMTDPVPNLIIPFWAVAAYAFIALKRKENTKENGEQQQ